MADKDEVKKDETNKDIIGSDIIINTLQLWKKIYDEKEAIIKFKKVDGTDRLMKVTLDFKKIPIKQQPKNTNPKQIMKLIQHNKIIRVYDIDKKDWRSIPYERIEYIDTKKKRFYIKKEK